MKILRSKREMMAVVTTVPIQVRFFLVNHIINFHERYDITIVSNLLRRKEVLNIFPENIAKYHIHFVREISILADIKTLFQLIFFFIGKNLILSIQSRLREAF